MGSFVGILPDPARIEARCREIRANGQGRSVEELEEALIRQTGMLSGAIGAVTSVGGIVTFLIGLPIDLYTSARLEARLAATIAALRDHETTDPARPDQLAALVAGLPVVTAAAAAPSLARAVAQDGAQELTIQAAQEVASRVTAPAAEAAARAGSRRLRTQTLPRVVVRVLPRALAKVVPLAGALIGFWVNWRSARNTGARAVAAYSDC